MRSGLLNFIEAGPLILFLVCYKLVEPDSSQDWLACYLAGAMAAVLTMFILRLKGMLLNPVFIGIDIYLLSGYLGLVTQQTWLIQIFDNLRASGMLASVVIVGTIKLFFSPAGFIGINSKNRATIVAYSVYLLIVALVAFLLAYSFRTNRIFAETVPFAILFLAHGVLKSRARTKIDAAKG